MLCAVPSEAYDELVGTDGLVPSRGDNANMNLGNPRGHKTLPYVVVVMEVSVGGADSSFSSRVLASRPPA
jgi:hypothetical protein